MENIHETLQKVLALRQKKSMTVLPISPRGISGSIVSPIAIHCTSAANSLKRVVILGNRSSCGTQMRFVVNTENYISKSPKLSAGIQSSMVTRTPLVNRLRTTETRRVEEVKLRIEEDAGFALSIAAGKQNDDVLLAAKAAGKQDLDLADYIDELALAYYKSPLSYEEQLAELRADEKSFQTMLVEQFSR